MGRYKYNLELSLQKDINSSSTKTKSTCNSNLYPKKEAIEGCPERQPRKKEAQTFLS